MIFNLLLCVTALALSGEATLMTKTRILLYVRGVVLATLAMVDLRADQTKEAAAVKAANAWLTIVD